MKGRAKIVANLWRNFADGIQWRENGFENMTKPGFKLLNENDWPLRLKLDDDSETENNISLTMPLKTLSATVS